jgi:uncharacterized membrane protein
MTKLIAYLAAGVPFALIDLGWLALMGERLYRPVLGDILRSSPNLTAAILFYSIYPIGLVAFAVLPALDHASSSRAFVLGLMYGFFTYVTYDLTNQATLRNWSTVLTSVDVAWGTTLAGICAYIAFQVAARTAGAS